MPDAEGILRDVLGGGADRELLEFAEGAGGDPGLLAELAHGLLEEGLVRNANGTFQLVERRLPRRVARFVMRRMGELSTPCRQFLKVAAVLGRSFMLEDASRMLERSSAALLSPLDEAIASGFVVAAEQRFAFQSDFVWQGIIESIPAPALGALRREAMERPGRCARPFDHEFWVTGRPTWANEPSAPPVETGPDTGAASSGAHGLIMCGRATAGIRVAERILASPSVPAAARRDAEASVILGYLVLGREEAENHAQRILRERGPGEGDVAVLMALTALSSARWNTGELALGLSLGRAAVRHGTGADAVWRMHLQLALAAKLTDLREFDMAGSLIDDAEAGLREASEPVWTAAPAAVRSRLFLQAGRMRDAHRQAELAIAATGRDAVPVLRPLAYSVLGTIALYRGDLPAAAEHLKRVRDEPGSDRAVLYPARYAWTALRLTATRDGARAAFTLLSEEYGGLATRRSLYIEDPGAAAFLVRLALDVDDADLRRDVLRTVDGLAEDNPGISVISLAALQANASANGDSAALERIVTQSPDPFSVALATAELAKHDATESPDEKPGPPIYPGMPFARSANGDPHHNSAPVGHENGAASPFHGGADDCDCPLTDMERKIMYLVSVGLTNRQIAKRVHLSAHTVNYHLRKIYRKIGINTRAELARVATLYAERARSAGHTTEDAEKWIFGHAGDAAH
ncbi:LuxR family transcriptional regulator [Actinomadura spongiicola]|uniref:LuxR family transcriptional regulator n=1 Tax=Actinomadura spongiicola TaxID=2303421 RepID=A0A372GGK5_9ACTN|nr:LuxR family transcriptional regulator [Actinomadura spongiicola]